MSRIAPDRSDRDADARAALHEVSNELTILLGWLERAVTERDPREAVAVALDRARRARTLARAALGAATPEPQGEPTALASLVRDAVRGVEPEAARRAVGVKLGAGPEGLSGVVADGEALSRALTNLLLNAIAFTRERSTVSLDVAREASAARFVVADDGPGLSDARREALFELGDAAYSTRQGGAGIGLRHAHELALAAGGGLRATRADAGARFELTWPVAPAPRATLEGSLIGVLDDDPAIGEIVATALEARGARVRVATDVAAYDRAFASDAPHAVLVDLSPLAGSAAAFLERVRRHASTKVVLISGSRGAIGDADVLALVDARVPKPFGVGELVEALVRLFASRA